MLQDDYAAGLVSELNRDRASCVSDNESRERMPGRVLDVAEHFDTCSGGPIKLVAWRCPVDRGQSNL